MRKFWRQVSTHEPLLVGLILLWCLLWGSFSPIVLLTGLIFSLLVDWVFYLPPVQLAGRFNLYWAVVYVVELAWRMISASFGVALIALLPNREPRVDIIKVELRTLSDFILTLTVMTTSVIPGSIVVDVNRDRSIIYLHVLSSVKKAEEAELSETELEALQDARKEAYWAETRLVQVLGDRRDILRVNQARAAAGEEPIIQSRSQREYESQFSLLNAHPLAPLHTSHASTTSQHAEAPKESNSDNGQAS